MLLAEHGLDDSGVGSLDIMSYVSSDNDLSAFERGTFCAHRCTWATILCKLSVLVPCYKLKT